MKPKNRFASMATRCRPSLKLGEEVYKATAKGPAGDGPGPAPEAGTDRGTTGDAKKDEDVIDAEYEVKE